MMRNDLLIFLGCFSIVASLSGCVAAEPDCGSVDAHDAVIRIASDHNNNPLINYAIKNSKAVAEEVSNSASGKAMSAYRAQREEIDAEWTKTNDQIREIQKTYLTKFRLWEEEKKKDGNLLPVFDRNAMWERIEKQTNDDIAPYKKKLDELQENRGGRDSEYPKLRSNEETEQSVIWEKAKQGTVYTLNTIRMSSRDSVTRAVTCRGRLSVFVESFGAVQDVGFTVERTTDGKMFVSVNWFAF
jgi:hypothetical protein